MPKINNVVDNLQITCDKVTLMKTRAITFLEKMYVAGAQQQNEGEQQHRQQHQKQQQQEYIFKIS